MRPNSGCPRKTGVLHTETNKKTTIHFPDGLNQKEGEIMKQKTVITGLVMFLVVAILTGCGTQTTSKQGTIEPIKIGVVTCLTGKLSDYGMYQKTSVEMAVKEINDIGGVNGRKIETIILDDQSEPSVSVNALKKLIYENKVDIVLGSPLSLASLAEMPVAEQAGMPLLVPVASSPTITKQGAKWMVAQMAVPDDVALANAATYAVRDLNLKRVAIIHENSDYGKGPAEAAAARVKELGGVVVAKETFNPADTDFLVILSKIKATNPDAMISMAQAVSAAPLVRQKSQVGLNVPLFVNQGNCSSVFIDQAGQFAEGTRSASFWSPFATDADSVKFVQNYVKFTGGKQPVQACAGAYDGIYLIADAVKKLGTTDKAKLQDYIRNVKDFKGVAGVYSFNEDGRNSMAMTIIQVQNGAWKVIGKLN